MHKAVEDAHPAWSRPVVAAQTVRRFGTRRGTDTR